MQFRRHVPVPRLFIPAACPQRRNSPSRSGGSGRRQGSHTPSSSPILSFHLEKSGWSAQCEIVYNLIYKIIILSLLKIQCPKGRVPHSHCRNPCRLWAHGFQNTRLDDLAVFICQNSEQGKFKNKFNLIHMTYYLILFRFSSMVVVCYLCTV